MPLDTCITNVGEYYSSHYLDSTFARDVRELVNRWREDGAQAPPRRLQRLGERYFRVKTQALDEDAPELRARASEEVAGWHAHLLQALGYTDVHAFDMPVEGGTTYRAAARSHHPLQPAVAGALRNPFLSARWQFERRHAERRSAGHDAALRATRRPA